jgi:poly-beta-1,6-N-acetyl-D-glucosamine N-deacetylase
VWFGLSAGRASVGARRRAFLLLRLGRCFRRITIIEVVDRPAVSKQVIARALRMTLLPAVLRATIQRRRATIVVYHDPSPDVFGRHVDALERHYTVISLRDLVEARKHDRVESLPARSLVITIDDGHKGNYRLKPVLERLNAPVTIFLCSAIVGTQRRFWFKHVRHPAAFKEISDEDRQKELSKLGFDESAEAEERDALSEREIEDLKGLVDFQSHTRSHPILPQCTAAKARTEISDSRRQLEETHGLRVFAIAYPDGAYSEREIAIARTSGYECGVTVDLGFNSSGTDIFRLKRICVDDRDSIDVMLVKVCGLWDFVKRRVGQRAQRFTPLERPAP